MKPYLLYGRASQPSEGENQQSNVTMAMTLLVMANGVVMDCEVSGCGQIMNTFVADMVIGKSIAGDINTIVQEIDDKVRSATAKALIVQAIQSVQKDCLKCKSELPWGSEEESD